MSLADLPAPLANGLLGDDPSKAGGVLKAALVDHVLPFIESRGS